MFDITGAFATSGQAALYRIVCMLVIVGVFGFMLALAARLMGDKGPGYDGRLTLNPLTHMEPIGALVMVIFRFGWIKPMAIDHKELKGGKWGMIVVVLASLLVIVALAAALWQLRPILVRAFPGAMALIAAVGMIEAFGEMAMWFVIINIFPVPPLAGGLLLSAFAPKAYEAIVARVYIPAAVLALFILTQVPERVLGPVIAAAKRIVMP